MSGIQKLKLIGHPGLERPFQPGYGGRTDIPCWDADCASDGWGDSGSYIEPHAKMGGAASFGNHTNVRYIALNDYTGATGIIGAVTAKGGPTAPAGPFSVFSLRYYMRLPLVPATLDVLFGGLGARVNASHLSSVNFMSGKTQIAPFVCFNNVTRPWGQVLDTDQCKLVVPGKTSLTTAKWINKWVRVEAQFNNAFTPKMVVRLYQADNTTPFQTWGYDPGFTSIGSVGITSGDNGAITSGWSPLVDVALLEVCDTYNLDGEFPGDGTAVATAVGQNPSGIGTPETEQISYTFPSELLPRDVPVPETFPSTTDFWLWRRGPDMTASITIPGGYPPTVDGWPVVVWVHGGFFSYGAFSDIPANWRSTLVNAGYAVVSIEYVKSTFAIGSYLPYGSAATQGLFQDGEPGFGRFPSWLTDVKLLIAKLPAAAADNGWNIDTSRVVTVGHSAGGYIAGGAAISVGVTDNGHGVDLTLAGNPDWTEGWTGPDPEILGAFLYAAPTDMQANVEYDSTDPGMPSVFLAVAGVTDRGLVAVTARSFVGVPATELADPDLTGTSLAELIAAKDAVGTVPPIACCFGTSDYLIPQWLNGPPVAAAMSAAGADYTEFESETIHDWVNSEFNPDEIIDWLDARIIESGGTPGPPSATPPVPGAGPVTFVGHDEYHDAGSAWPASLTITDPPVGTSRGDRLFLVVLSFVTDPAIDNWNPGDDWTLLAEDDTSAGTTSGFRSSIHVYTARHQDGAPLPTTISPRTAAGALLPDPGSGGWYRAHLFSVTPSHPVNTVELARGGNFTAQPDYDRDAVTVDTLDYLLQFTAYLAPSTRVLGTLSSPGSAVSTYIERVGDTAIAGRGGETSIADATVINPTTSDLWALYSSEGSGTGVTVRASLIVMDAQLDPALPPDTDPCSGLTAVSVPTASPTSFILDGETFNIETLDGTGTVTSTPGSGLTVDGVSHGDPAIHLAADYGTVVSGTPLHYSVTATLVSGGCTLTADPTVRLVGVVDGVGTVITTGTATDTGGGVWHLLLDHVMLDTWPSVYVITSAPTECV